MDYVDWIGPGRDVEVEIETLIGLRFPWRCSAISTTAELPSSFMICQLQLSIVALFLPVEMYLATYKSITNL